MKKKIAITGPKVHDVGYRPFLAEMALDISPKGFEVYNDELVGRQAIIVLIEGDDRRISRFIETVRKEQPSLAKIHEINVEDYTDEVMPAWQGATTALLKQFNKAVPVLQDISGGIKGINKDTGDIKEGIKALVDGQMVMIEEIRGLLEDLDERNEARFARIEKDIAALKARNKMR